MKKNHTPAQQLVFQFNVLQVAVNLPGASMYASSQERAVPDVPSMTKPEMTKAAMTKPAKTKAAKSQPRKKSCTSAYTSTGKSTTTRSVTKTRRKTTTNIKTNLKKLGKRTEARR